ncbi:ankyrin repeat domain-containing protein [Sphingobium algorifonticola]|uniref:Ankyrin repeat domain-containing protein n=1 Tax=Sphingobium algorifonticola TaxID=2008318 RepID=A0A437JDK9_9SPHN|nr:ankyrin repeat domain-containing protein [Sphingobium algorifonticola]RVT43833.1 ankyrin repeat domain-containing protein [Sphingobium algorifonticola]
MNRQLITVTLGLGLRDIARCAALAVPLAAMVAPQVAQAQFSDSYNFLKAVRDRDGEKATTLLSKPGGTVINTRDLKTGETALHIVVARRDPAWLNFLLAKGGKPDLANTQGDTPLMLATQLRWADGIRVLLANGATIDKANDNGETPLIRAVQLRDLGTVRLLVAQGANPDKRDTIAGMSARDYAEREGRAAGLSDALSAAKPVKPANSAVQGPSL